MIVDRRAGWKAAPTGAVFLAWRESWCRLLVVSPRRRASAFIAATAVALLAGCASDERLRDSVPLRPEEVRAQIAGVLPASTPDRPGWASDVYTALAALGLPTIPPNICAVLAVTEQESSYQADPAVPNLGKIARAEIDRRADGYGVPRFAVGLALQIGSPNGRTYAERIDAARTERELSEIFEDFIGMVPLGKRLFADYNPVRTAGPMQVSIPFAEAHAQRRKYPYPIVGTLRNEVFTRRGGLYFGTAHLLDYPANYDKLLFRFADFNAGQYASRNAAFQSAVSLASGVTLDLDGDLVRRGGGDTGPSKTELAVRNLGKRLELSDEAIRRALELDDGPELERSALYKRVFDLAERIEGRALPRAVVPRIALKGPKISRKLTTEWFANRVEERHRRCLARLTPAAG